MTETSLEQLRQENDELRRRLEEAEDTIRAIRGGEVDALVITDTETPKVFTLDSADKPYRLLVEQMNQGAATLHLDGTILYCNQRFADLLDLSLEALLGSPIHQFVEDSSVLLFDALVRDGVRRAVEGEIFLKRRSGVSVPVFLGVSALQEGPAGVCLMVTDLTEQKRQERIIAQEALARSILEQVADAVIVCDVQGRVLRASRTAYVLCGDNPILRSWKETFPLRMRGAHTEERLELDAAWRGETIQGQEVYFDRPDGKRFHLLLSAGPLRSAHGEILGAAITLTDITIRKQAEDALRAADQRKDEFLATLAHELRNPLAPLRNALNILERAGQDEGLQMQARKVMSRQLEQMTRLVDDLLDLSRITRDKIELRWERTELTTVLTSALETCRSVIEDRKHTLHVDLPTEPIPVRADLTRLAQVFTNLLNNAAKYTPPGGQIWLKAERQGEEVLVQVRDSGIGIAKEMLPRIFDMFTQVDSALTHAQGGLGIGLTLVKRLVGMHGGSVAAMSAGEGHGSEFVVRLPVLDASATAAAIPVASPTRESFPTQGSRILVVDDNHDSAESLALFLRLVGNTVEVAYDGPTALVAARVLRPDLILLDIGLPGMDGYEVARCLRQEPGLERALLVAQTGWGQAEDRRRSSDAGFDHHLVKPVDLTQLQQLLRTANKVPSTSSC